MHIMVHKHKQLKHESMWEQTCDARIKCVKCAWSDKSAFSVYFKEVSVSLTVEYAMLSFMAIGLLETLHVSS